MPDPVAFISYKHEPRSNLLAEELFDQLTKRGITVWYDGELNAGERWSQTIDARIDQATFVIVIVTPGSAGYSTPSTTALPWPEMKCSTSSCTGWACSRT